ncbi:hypothetical protein CANCADRAFT_53660 [Tortispora caseinolytica NRRL Y-17796]|uniref:NADH-ubiquinone oxidoreductase 12 kDa subunit n=1 Tax=Tortispora caseinolytica NRRL Y-17796 TaxID=767744 RepID=A0A1E4TBL7_9ASCO|nr:hypothetical protein CANCADRAFT_53660 [Tortispora caseinolytica NRRL Y-17796]
MTGTKHPSFEKVSFDDIDYSKPGELLQAQESELREQWLKAEAFRQIQTVLSRCYRQQKTNSQENCRDIAEKYLEMLPKSNINGFLGIQRNDPSK